MGSMDDVHAELDDVRDLLGEDCAFKVRVGRLLSPELSPVQYVRAAVLSYVDMQMDETERGETVVVEADEWERVHETAAEALQKWERLKAEVSARGSDRSSGSGLVPLEPEGAVRLAEKDRSEAERRQKLAAARNGATPPPPDKDRMVDQVRTALATVQHCDQRAAKARKRREDEGRPAAESWETPKPVSKPEPAPKPKSEPKSEVKPKPKPKPKATSVKTSAAAVAGQRPKPKNVPKGSLWAGSSDEEVMSAVLTVISPDPDEKEYTMSDLAHGIFYVDQSGAISGRAFRFRMDAFKVPFREDVKEGTTRKWRVYVKRDIRKTFGG